ncbi:MULTISPECIES: putative toxin-antitoxin system toxin component, PIN family [Thiorhodovibrio]|uniref:putative toxin-antitoxin system toxin component, PIN family n=1 Tax=Thiorhodovibrio TaxID=61593 RepID=UPI0019128A7D|nr:MULTISPECIES: putative toxin-antitoxin system toxin component, PIN family [Thiorhodovibrio]MBK5971310.1 putative toxin-antitoxin system toxin component, PIN family [Thiorhodovibrio winogradskyi]WPL13865.1 putative toxin-antitoxin system toxin component, PIN family [Thiorhodovibrio litoralis]
MRIVADTNTVVSGLLWKGAPRQIIEACRHQRITIVTSERLIAELAEVLARDKFASRINSAGLTPLGLVEDYSALTEYVHPGPLNKPVCRDPDDDAVLACALAGRADALVSGDDDLLTLKVFRGIPIITVAEWLRWR